MLFLRFTFIMSFNPHVSSGVVRVLLLSPVFRGGKPSTEKLSSTDLTCEDSYLTRVRESPTGLGGSTFPTLVYSGSVLLGVMVPHLVHIWSTSSQQHIHSHFNSKSLQPLDSHWLEDRGQTCHLWASLGEVPSTAREMRKSGQVNLVRTGVYPISNAK